MNFIYIAAGILLLFLGRKLFWLFVAVVGFLVGLTYIPQILPGQEETVILAISLIAGLLGALLAVLLQKIAIGLAGLVAGGYIAYYLLQTITLNVGQYQWMAIVAGALLGAVLAGSMYDWALILLTSLSGAVVITQNIPISMPISAVIFLGLTIIGIVAQTRMKIKG
ncbi:MAG: DUF4203 domain-containing protein [Anaerolineaceae bacterium]|nr:DUF4203 domain-containing protein [Anaerolineaceae bacterium]